MPIFYFVRHGETDWNAQQRLQGQHDTRLNDQGRRQAARNGRTLAALLGSGRERPDYVASPLSRATETMEIVRAALDLPPSAYRTELRLREIHHGSWEGKLREEIRAEDLEKHEAFTRDPWSFAPPGEGAESYAVLSARVWEWFGALERDTVIVAHGGASRCIQGRLLGTLPVKIPHLKAPQDLVLRIENGEMTWC